MQPLIEFLPSSLVVRKPGCFTYGPTLPVELNRVCLATWAFKDAAGSSAPTRASLVASNDSDALPSCRKRPFTLASPFHQLIQFGLLALNGFINLSHHHSLMLFHLEVAFLSRRVSARVLVPLSWQFGIVLL